MDLYKDWKSQTVFYMSISQEFISVIQNEDSEDELYKQVSELSQNYLQDELAKQEIAVTQAKELNESQDKEIKQLVITNEENERNIRVKDQQLKKAALKATRFEYFIKWWGVFLLIIAGWLAIATLILFEFFWCDSNWNKIGQFFLWVKNKTNFGLIDNCIYLITAIPVGVWLKFTKKFFKNPLNKKKSKVFRLKLIKNYLKNLETVDK